MLNVHSIETFGTHEGPGIRLVVFLQGCPWRCLYCHNPDTQAMDHGKEISKLKIVRMAVDQKPYFKNNGGVTVSGGEPLVQAEALIDLFKLLKNDDIHTALDTNGCIFNDQVKELLNYTDLVILDIKQINNEEHKKLTGAGNENTLALANYLKEINKPMWIRHVLVPSLTDSAAHLESIGEYFKEFKNVERLELLPYHTLGKHKYEHMGMDYKLAHLEPPTTEQVEEAKKILEKYFDKVIVG